MQRPKQQRSRGNAGDCSDVSFLTFIFSKKEKLFEFPVFSVEKYEKTESQQWLIGLFATNIIPPFVPVGHVSE